MIADSNGELEMPFGPVHVDVCGVGTTINGSRMWRKYRQFQYIVAYDTWPFCSTRVRKESLLCFTARAGVEDTSYGFASEEFPEFNLSLGSEIELRIALCCRRDIRHCKSFQARVRYSRRIVLNDFARDERAHSLQGILTLPVNISFIDVGTCLHYYMPMYGREALRLHNMPRELLTVEVVAKTKLIRCWRYQETVTEGTTEISYSSQTRNYITIQPHVPTLTGISIRL